MTKQIAIAFVFSAVVLALCIFPNPARAGDVPRTADTLRAELQAVHQQIAEARTNLAAQGKALWQKQHDLEYSDPDCAQLRDEIKNLEGQLLAKRNQLDALLKTKAPIAEIEAERKRLVENLAALQQQEQLIQNEILALGGTDAAK